MNYSTILNPFLWSLFKLILGAVLCILVFGFLVGLYTYAYPIKRRRSKNDGILDDVMELGEILCHVLIDYIRFSLLKGDRRNHVQLNDRQLLARLRGLNPSEFEEFVEKYFQSQNFKTELNGGSGDGGIDIFLEKEGKHSVVQCKKYITRKVNPHDVRDFFGAMTHEGIDGKGFFVTTHIFTLEAENFAEGKPMELIDGNALIRLIKQSGMDLSFLINHTSSVNQVVPQVEKKYCSVCGSEMILRTNGHNGSQFFGCSNYPKCKYTKNVF
jgi:restriction system protein